MGRDRTNLVLGMSAREAQLEKDLAKARRHLKRFQGQNKTISTGINKSMVGMFSVFSAGVVARDIFQTVTGFEKQMDKVRAISGATGKEMERLSDSAVEIGRASKFTANEIGQLQEELARLGFRSKDIIASTDAIRKLATAADSELAESAKTVASTINAFNLSAEQSGEVANIMAESFSKSALSLEKFQVGMSNVGAAANAAGYNLGQTTAMLGVLNDAGIDASKAGTDLRTIFIELAASGMSVDQAYNTILTSQDKLSTAVSLFGKRAANSAIVLAENQEKVSGLSSELTDANAELDDMVSIMEDNLITDLQKLKSAWDGFILSLEDGSGVGSSALRGITKGVTDLLNGLSDWDTFTSGTDWKKIAEDQKKINEVAKEFERIKLGETFNNISVETMGYTQAIDILDKRLSAFKQNKHYEEIAEAVQAYKEELKKANQERERELTTIRQQIQAFEDLKSSTSGITNIPTVGTDGPQLAKVGPLQISDNSEFWEKTKADTAARYADFTAFMMEQNTMLNDTVSASLAGAISGFTEGIVTDGLKGALDGIAIVFADGLAQIGKQLIAFGTTMIIAKKALQSPLSSGGAAIAAGLAAVAAASLLKSAIANTSGNTAASLGGGSSRGTGSFQNNIQGQSIQFTPKPIEVRFQNGSLTGMIEFEQSKNRRLQG